jgi:hypothetical protein
LSRSSFTCAAEMFTVVVPMIPKQPFYDCPVSSFEFQDHPAVTARERYGASRGI